MYIDRLENPQNGEQVRVKLFAAIAFCVILVV